MISTNLRQVIGEIDKYKLDVKANVKATRDELARTAQMLMKAELSQRQSYTGRGANKKFIPTANGAPPAKQSGTLFRAIKAKKWEHGGRYNASVGLIKAKGAAGRDFPFWGVILESSNRAAAGTLKTPRTFKKAATGGGKGKGRYPQRAPGVHKWASPAFHKFEPMVNPIIAKRMGGVK